MGGYVDDVSLDFASSDIGDADSGANIDDRTAINIAPVGVNLGSIIEPMNAGAPTNGGLGIEMLSRYFPQITTQGAVLKGRPNKIPITPVVMAVGAAGIVVFLYFVLK